MTLPTEPSSAWPELPTRAAAGGARRGCRPTLFAALLTLSAQAMAQPESDAVDHGWRGVTTSSSLADESILTEYGAERAARGEDGARMGVTFSPRFGCSPVPRLVLSAALAQRLDASNGLLLRITIDDDPLVWPALLDRSEGEVMLTYEGSERERSTLRLQIDIGEFAELEIDKDLSLTFSLLGSRRSLAAIESLCLEHDAIPWDGG